MREVHCPQCAETVRRGDFLLRGQGWAARFICPKCGAAFSSANEVRVARGEGTSLLLQPGPAAGTAAGERRLFDERKTCTVLFADVSGYTALSERLDPESVWRLMNRCFEGLVRAIRSEGGHIDKFMGDAVMALFGAPVAHEDDPARAVRAALGMQQFLAEFRERLSRETGVVLRMRIGVNTGRVLAGYAGAGDDRQYTVMGDAVNLASRLEHAAPLDGVLVSEATARHLAGRFTLTAREPIAVKGKERPVTTFIVAGERRDAEADAQAEAEGGFRFVDRRTELDDLCAALAAALERRRPDARVLTGPGGIGKSRLFTELFRHVRRLHPGVTHVRVQCEEGGVDTAHFFSAELVRKALRLAHGVEDLSSLPRRAALLAEIFAGQGLPADEVAATFAALLDRHRAEPVAEGSPGATPPGAGVAVGAGPLAADADEARARRAAFHIRLFLERTAARRPLVIYGDDTAFMDAASANVVQTILELAPDAPIFFVLNQRTPRAAPWDRYEIPLRPFSETDSTRLAADILRVEETAARDVGAAVHGRAGGNPFFVQELTLHLRETGLVTVQRGRTALSGDDPTLATAPLPSSVEGVIQARVDRLPPEQKEMLKRAAVIGRAFWDLALLEFGFPRHQVDEALAGLLARQIVEERGHSRVAGAREFLFPQPLLREAVYEGELTSRRREVHAATGRWLMRVAGRSVPALFVEMAHHLDLGGLPAEAAEYYRLAGDQARAQWLNQEAAACYAHAGSLLSPPDGASPPKGEGAAARWRQGVIGRGEALHQLGRFGEARAAFERVLAADAAGADQAALVSRVARTFDFEGRLTDAVERYNEAVALFATAGDLAGETATRTQLAAALLLAGDPAAAALEVEKSRAAAQALRSEPLAAGALLADGSIHYARREWGAAAERFQAAADLYTTLGDEIGVGKAVGNLGAALHESRRYDEAAKAHERSLAISRRTGDLPGAAMSLVNIGAGAVALGDYARAEALLLEAQDLQTRLGGGAFGGHILYHLADLARRRGQFALARDLLDQARRAASATQLSDLLEAAARLDALVVARDAATP
ncbi:MAG: tetratricopeptide repeat protein [Planctomycetes bacterium]|nr:tetratricopeptide repeat protein [Planctomycetota bacterium]